ncbi:acyl--CoA ligase [Sphingomonas sp. CGMCC 1.13654]|uniref:Acyl--CoA ligase n=1 Tax=Sphingomonas chungangi TaxID=2683589 RepID=A0A838L2M2_9SPHN|nr:class I adenylate-forming enzyme family protein [Sphingomonas chungangi]MBA2933743.1 acyl--CoA ligase [Sphingomonas chungangi]MVW55074.1 AMP-binding protein [Sphingomonas chungangi]
MGFTVTSAFRWWVREHPNRVAVDFDGEELTYADLSAWSSRVAAALIADGIRPGDRVSICAANTLDYAVLIVAIMLSGGIHAPLSFRSSARELRGSLDTVTPSLLFTDADRAGTAREALGDEAGKLRSLDVIRPLREATAPAPSTLHHAEPDEPVFIIGTSGSTGTPKGVVYSHRSIMTYAAEFAIMEPRTGNGGSILAAGPYSSTSGTLLLMQFLSVGNTIYTQSRFTPELALKLLQEKKITTFLASTIFFERIAALPEFAAADLSTIAFAQISGARVNPAILQAYREKGVVLRPAYGCTEAGGAWAARDETAFSEPEKCGPGAIFTEFAIRGEDGGFAPAGTAGEILIRSGALSQGYWNNPQATAETFRDGWLHTGDKGVLDERGNLTFIDRIKDIIISGGLNISAMEVESVIAEVPGVEEVVVLSAQDDQFGETPLAVVHGDARVTIDAIIAHCNAHLANYKVPRYVAIEPEPLPRMASGKISKVILREKFKDAAGMLPKVR